MLESFHGNTFEYKKLTEDEQSARGILGRLVGIIADTKNPTRNGRLYSAQLWENVFKNPIMQEKIKNRVCFGELDHPADREEIDTSKIAVCLAEQPKIGTDGNLYGVFDILSTPNGRILKTLCEYGSTVGISSRGSGDIMSNDEVDPDTYDCVGFDVVLVPAVESARLKYVCESLENKPKKSINEALAEEYKKATDADKKVMKESLDNLHIDIFDIAAEDIPFEEFDDMVISEAVEEEPAAETKEPASDEDVTEAEALLDIEAEEEEAPVIKDDAEDAESEEETKDIECVKDLLDILKDVPESAEISMTPIDLGDAKVEIEKIDFCTAEDGNLVVTVIAEKDEKSNSGNTDDIEVDSEKTDAVEETEQEAVDDGLAEVLENVKELVRANTALEEEIKNLKAQKAVDDVKANELQESLIKYKESFVRVSQIAAKTRTIKAELNTLQEKYAQTDAELSNKQKALNEANTANAELKSLLESAKATVVTDPTLVDECDALRAKLKEAVERTNAYKRKCTAILTHYIDYRALALGVASADITSRLTENYTMSDIDTVCEQLVESNFGYSKLPFATGKVKMTESMGRVKSNASYENEYGVDDDLLELAGLK